MAATEKRTSSLPVEQAAFTDAQVRTGSFASAGEAVRAGLRALQERDTAVARWLRDAVSATHDAMKAHPGRLISGEDIAERMCQRHEARIRAGR